MNERVRELLGFEGARQRYHDVESVRDLEEISDPTTIDDETQQTIREWLVENRLIAVSFGLLAFIVGSLSVAMFWRYMPMIATNRYVQATVVAIGLLVLGARYGWNANQRRVEDIDELSLQIGDYVLPVKGLHVPGGRKKPPRFLPIKGYRRPGMTPRPYTVADVDPDVIERGDGRIDPDLPAMIRLHPEYAASTQTDTGTRVVQLADDLEADSEGDWAVLVATPPNTADKEKVRRINEANRELASEKKDLKERLEQKDETINSLRDEVNRPVDERVDDRMKLVERGLAAARGRVSHGDREAPSSEKRMSNGHRDTELEEVHAEVTVDEDD